jgi:hypothetical protein
MGRSVPGRVNVIALEEIPASGKTTAVREHLEQKPEGYLFLYVSPRVVINRDVTQSLARKGGEPSGILTITTNARTHLVCASLAHERGEGRPRDRKQVDGAVVVDGVPTLVKPNGAILVISPGEEQEIEAAHAGSRIGKTTISENEDIVDERTMAGRAIQHGHDNARPLGAEPRGQPCRDDRCPAGLPREGRRQDHDGRALKPLQEQGRRPGRGVRERRGFAKNIPNYRGVWSTS